MATDTGDVEHLIVAQDVFAGGPFWAAVDRLGDRRGHYGHQRFLVGSVEATNRYELRCITCDDRAIATMDVRREATPG